MPLAKAERQRAYRERHLNAAENTRMQLFPRLDAHENEPTCAQLM